jgi:error-prone DNA polymerase
VKIFTSAASSVVRTLCRPDGCWIEAAGLVLVRQRPASAKGVMFVTIEDETGIANLVIWQKVFDKHRRVVLAANMIAVRGRVQREGEVVHLVAHHLTDLTATLASIRERESSEPHGRGDQLRHGASPDPRVSRSKGSPAPDGRISDLQGDAIRMKIRDFK